MKLKFFVYAALIGLLFRQIEVLFIGIPMRWFGFWHPGVWLGYALAAVISYLSFLVILRFFSKKHSVYFQGRLALFYTCLLFIWVSISSNANFILSDNGEVIGYRDWLLNLAKNLAIFLVPIIIIISFIIFLVEKKLEKKRVDTFSLSKRAKVVIFLLVGIMLAESIFVTFFMPSFFEKNKKNPYNVILISVDTLRKDHLSLYGYARETTPNLDRFFSNGIRFERCIATIPETGPSYTSIYTGTYPFKHKVYLNGYKFSQGSTFIPTIAQELGKNGYYSSSHLTNPFPGTTHNLDLGIDELYQRGVKMTSSSGYDVYSTVRNILACIITVQDHLTDNRRLGPETVRAIKWLSSKPKEPFYTHIFWHWPHQEYEERKVDTPEGFGKPVNYETFASSVSATRDSIRERRRQYDSDIYYTDIQIGAIMDALEKNGYLDHSIVIFTADHGEDVGERFAFAGEGPFFGHSYWLYESSVCVPLVFLFPDKELSNQKVSFPVSSIDIFPSVLSLLGLDKPESLQGQALFEGDWGSLQIREELPSLRPYVYSFYFHNEKSTKSDNFSGIFGEQYTLHRTEKTKKIELYDIKRDYHSTQEISANKPEIAATLQMELDNWLKTHNYSHSQVQEMSRKKEPMSEKMLKKLRSLGYID
ncbi:MAG: sulfatase [Planctomycetes bacterium]|nr:sulfatase [Planctomycetota bacterium]